MRLRKAAVLAVFLCVTVTLVFGACDVKQADDGEAAALESATAKPTQEKATAEPAPTASPTPAPEIITNSDNIELSLYRNHSDETIYAYIMFRGEYMNSYEYEMKVKLGDMELENATSHTHYSDGTYGYRTKFELDTLETNKLYDAEIAIYDSWGQLHKTYIYEGLCYTEDGNIPEGTRKAVIFGDCDVTLSGPACSGIDYIFMKKSAGTFTADEMLPELRTFIAFNDGWSSEFALDAGVLAYMPGLLKLELSDSDSFQGDITVLGTLHNLEELTVYELKLKKGQSAFFENLTNLIHLDILSVKGLELEKLAGLKKLEYMQLFVDIDEDYYSPYDYSALGELHSLKMLNLSISPGQNTRKSKVNLDIGIFKELYNLESLTIQASREESDFLSGDISALSELINLKELELDDHDASLTGDIAALSGLTGMERLEVGPNSGLEGDISALSGMINLQEIELVSENITGDISVIGSWPLIHRITLGDNLSGDLSGISSGYNSLYLMNLYLSGDEITGDLGGLAESLYPDGLQSLILECSVSGNLDVLSGFTNLYKLELTSEKTEGDIASLMPLAALRTLKLECPNVTGDTAGIAAIAANGVSILRLSSDGITGDIAEFESMEEDSLEYLYLDSTGITGNGIVLAKFVKNLQNYYGMELHCEGLEGDALDNYVMEGYNTLTD